MISEKLMQATFKGVPFFWRRLSTNGGKKSVSHNYPGSSRRFVEDMGALPKTFTLEASIAGGLGGAQYMENKQSLEAALSSPGPGWLVHPTYGRVLVTAKPFTCTEETSRLGEAKYSLTFEKSDEEVRPIGSTSNLREIEVKKDQALNEIVETAADEWTVPDSPSIFDLVSSKVNGLADQINDAVGAVSAVRADAYQVFNSIQGFKNSVSTLVSQPIGLFNDVKGIYDQVMSMDDFISDQFDRITGFFGASSDSGPGQVSTVGQKISPISYETQQAEQNRVVMNEASNMMALVNAYSSISKIDFDSTEQLDDFVDRIESQFSIMEQSGLMDKPLRDTVLSLRITSHNVIEQKRLLTKRIVESEFKNDIPLNVALYMFEGNIDDSDYILGLNQEQDQTFAKGEIRLLQ